MTALLGTFVNVKTMADGTPRLVLDLQCTLAEIAALGLIPGTPFGIARISGESTIAPVAEPEPATDKPGPLCILACRWCKDPEFWEFLRSESWVCSSEDEAKELVCGICQIKSRRELDSSDFAEHVFHVEVREPFMCWKAAQ